MRIRPWSEKEVELNKILNIMFFILAVSIIGFCGLTFYVERIITFKARVIIAVVFALIIAALLTALRITSKLIKTNTFGEKVPPTGHFGFFKYFNKIPEAEYYITMKHRTESYGLRNKL